MAGLDYLVPEITALIAEFGVAATLEVTVATVNSSTQVKTGETVTQYAVTATPPNPFKRSFLGPGEAFIRGLGSPGDSYAGGAAVSEDLETIIAAEGLAVVPAPGYRLILASATYVVMGVTVLKTGDSTAAYQLAVRKA